MSEKYNVCTWAVTVTRRMLLCVIRPGGVSADWVIPSSVRGHSARQQAICAAMSWLRSDRNLPGRRSIPARAMPLPATPLPRWLERSRRVRWTPLPLRVQLQYEPAPAGRPGRQFGHPLAATWFPVWTLDNADRQPLGHLPRVDESGLGDGDRRIGELRPPGGVRGRRSVGVAHRRDGAIRHAAIPVPSLPRLLRSAWPLRVCGWRALRPEIPRLRGNSRRRRRRRGQAVCPVSFSCWRRWVRFCCRSPQWARCCAQFGAGVCEVSGKRGRRRVEIAPSKTLSQRQVTTAVCRPGRRNRRRNSVRVLVLVFRHSTWSIWTLEIFWICEIFEC